MAEKQTVRDAYILMVADRLDYRGQYPSDYRGKPLREWMGVPFRIYFNRTVAESNFQMWCTLLHHRNKRLNKGVTYETIEMPGEENVVACTAWHLTTTENEETREPEMSQQLGMIWVTKSAKFEHPFRDDPPNGLFLREWSRLMEETDTCIYGGLSEVKQRQKVSLTELVWEMMAEVDGPSLEERFDWGGGGDGGGAEEGMEKSNRDGLMHA